MTSIESQEIIDISPLICAETAVFPGDTPFSSEVLLDMRKGDNLTLSNFTTTVHIGAHTDAPNHYCATGEGIAERNLNYYIGTAQVIDVSDIKAQRLRVEHLKNKKIQAPRVIFKTNTFPDPNNWNNDFTALSADLVNHLFKHNVVLVGIDTPSIDPANDKILESHNEINKNNMAILEGVVLTHVHEGLYTLIALPLKIKNADASPVRAVLMKETAKEQTF